MCAESCAVDFASETLPSEEYPDGPTRADGGYYVLNPCASIGVIREHEQIFLGSAY